MKRLYILKLLWIVFFFLPGQAGGDQTLVPGLSGQRRSLLKTVIVANYSPYSFVNKDGLPDGFSVDLAKAVTTVMGMELEIREETWDRARRQLATGEIDFLPMMAYSKERDREFDFSVPHTIAYDAFFARKNGKRLRTMEDLKGQKVIVMKGDQAHDYLLATGLVASDDFLLIAGLPEALRLLSSGQGDAALMPKLVGLMAMQELHLSNLAPAPVVVESYNRPFSFAVREGNLLLLERLNQGLHIVKDTGQYRHIYDRWFGALEPREITLKAASKYIVWLFLALLLVGSAFALWSMALKMQVTARTRKLEDEIAERTRVEEELRASEARLAEAQHIAKLGCWEWDIAGNRLWWSEEAFRIFGVAPEAFGATFEAFIAAVHPDDREQVQGAINEALRHDGGAWQLDYRLVRADGGIRFAHEEARTIFDREGRPLKRMGTVQDVTERKQAEEERLTHLNFLEILNQINRAIQGREDLDQMMSDVLNAVLSIFDCDRAWLFYPCDPEAPTFRVPMEVTTPEYPGAKVLNVDVPLPPDMAKNLREALESAEPVTYALGTERPVNALSAGQFKVQSMMMVALYPKSGKPWAFGLHQCSCPRLWTLAEKRLFLEIARRLADALTALLTNRDLRESEEKYRRIVDTANEGIWVLGPDTVTTFVNARMAEMLGYSGAEMLGRPVTDFMFEEDAPDHLKKMENRRRGLSEHYERRYRRKNGQTVWVLASAVPILDAGRNFKGTFGMFTDITAKRQAEEELRRLNDELEQRVMQRTAELAAKNRELERMNQLFIGRELRMVELKEKIRELESR